MNTEYKRRSLKDAILNNLVYPLKKIADAINRPLNPKKKVNARILSIRSEIDKLNKAIWEEIGVGTEKKSTKNLDHDADEMKRKRSSLKEELSAQKQQAQYQVEIDQYLNGLSKLENRINKFDFAKAAGDSAAGKMWLQELSQPLFAEIKAHCQEKYLKEVFKNTSIPRALAKKVEKINNILDRVVTPNKLRIQHVFELTSVLKNTLPSLQLEMQKLIKGNEDPESYSKKAAELNTELQRIKGDCSRIKKEYEEQRIPVSSQVKELLLKVEKGVSDMQVPLTRAVKENLEKLVQMKVGDTAPKNPDKQKIISFNNQLQKLERDVKKFQPREAEGRTMAYENFERECADTLKEIYAYQENLERAGTKLSSDTRKLFARADQVLEKWQNLQPQNILQKLGENVLQKLDNYAMAQGSVVEDKQRVAEIKNLWEEFTAKLISLQKNTGNIPEELVALKDEINSGMQQHGLLAKPKVSTAVKSDLPPPPPIPEVPPLPSDF
jgi:hypothetical protein